MIITNIIIILHEILLIMANKLKQILKEQGRSQRWLAEQLEIHEVTVNNWCRNNNKPLGKMVSMAIAEVLKIDIKDLTK